MHDPESTIVVATLAYAFSAVGTWFYLRRKHRQLLARYQDVRHLRKRRRGVLAVFFSPAAADGWFSLGFPLLTALAAACFILDHSSAIQYSPLAGWYLLAVCLFCLTLPAMNRRVLRRELEGLRRLHQLDTHHAKLQDYALRQKAVIRRMQSGDPQALAVWKRRFE